MKSGTTLSTKVYSELTEEEEGLTTDPSGSLTPDPSPNGEGSENGGNGGGSDAGESGSGD